MLMRSRTKPDMKVVNPMRCDTCDRRSQIVSAMELVELLF